MSAAAPPPYSSSVPPAHRSAESGASDIPAEPPVLPPLHFTRARRQLPDPAYRQYMVEGILANNPPVSSDRSSSGTTKTSSSMVNATAANRTPSACASVSASSSNPNSPQESTELGHISSTPAALAKAEKINSKSTNNSSPQPGSVLDRRDPFAHDGGAGGVNYKSMAWWQAGMVMIAETISLGILSLPSALSTLGLIPGLILLLSLGALATYTGYVIGQFKLRYPRVHSMADAGEILFGRVGREVLGAGQLIFFIFIMGAHILTFSIMMNAITDHAACTVLFMVVGAVLSFLLTLPRTLRNMSYWSIASFVSIIGAVMITMVGVGVTNPRGHGPIDLWPRQPRPQFHDAFLAVANIIFAYAGHVAFFSFISELREPRDFPKALALLQVSDMSMYVVTAVVVYCFTGRLVKSPALDSASLVVRKVAYGVACPTIVIAGVVNGHVAVKYLYVRLLRDSKGDVIHQRSVRAYGIWAGIDAVLWIVAWVIAEGVPVFNDLLGLTSVLFASWFTFGLSGLFWLHLDRKRQLDGEMGTEMGMFRSGGYRRRSWRRMVLYGVNVFNVFVGLSICVIGLYASGKSIAINKETNKTFSCADNSHR